MENNNEMPEWAKTIVELNEALLDNVETLEYERDQAKAIEEERQAALASEQAKPGEEMSEAVSRYAERRKQGYEGDLPGRNVSEDPYTRKNTVSGSSSWGGKEI